MTNEITKHNTWKNALQAQDGAASDAAVTALTRLLLVNDANSQDELIQLLRAEGDLVFLARHPEGHLVWVHHLTVHGGGRVNPNIYFTALVGIGPRALPIKFNSGQLFRSLSVLCPSWTNLKDLTTRQALVDAPLGQNEEVFPTLLALPPSISDALKEVCLPPPRRKGRALFAMVRRKEECRGRFSLAGHSTLGPRTN